MTSPIVRDTSPPPEARVQITLIVVLLRLLLSGIAGTWRMIRGREAE
jgi:hypothetical protein